MRLCTGTLWYAQHVGHDWLLITLNSLTLQKQKSRSTMKRALTRAKCSMAIHAHLDRVSRLRGQTACHIGRFEDIRSDLLLGHYAATEGQRCRKDNLKSISTRKLIPPKGSSRKRLDSRGAYIQSSHDVSQGSAPPTFGDSVSKLDDLIFQSHH